MGGCGSIYFQRILCSLIIIDSVFISNKARQMGGALFLQHSSGNITFINNTFRNNSAKKYESNDSDASVKESAGGAIYSFGYTSSIIYLLNNFFLQNQAMRGYF